MSLSAFRRRAWRVGRPSAVVVAAAPAFAGLLAACSAAPTGDSVEGWSTVTSEALTGHVGSSIARVGSASSFSPYASTAPSYSPRVTAGDGTVIKQVHVKAVFWGPSVSASVRATMPVFFGDIVASSYTSWLSEYGAHPSGYAGAVTITPSRTQTALTDDDIASELASQINKNVVSANIDNNELYFVFLPPGVSVSFTSNGTLERSCKDFCGYHVNHNI
jgi:hypothetical protein